MHQKDSQEKVKTKLSTGKYRKKKMKKILSEKGRKIVRIYFVHVFVY